ncbi:MAG: hypothetical protein F6K04_00255 [Leptolyngbya sp. SIO4C5]|uniref:hypothetical protein n=1 Tax=Sphaerothrix gracilis TaxID=3151835 RepID=UPI0013BFF89D|nr:hypothetical protein [Leptolyngbya sp. SIO4C5]
MLATQFNCLSYHGWQIQVAQEDQDFYFECYPPDQLDFCNDGEYYSDRTAAFCAAREFVDRELAIQALLDIAEEWLESGCISETEYWNLTDFA